MAAFSSPSCAVPAALVLALVGATAPAAAQPGAEPRVWATVSVQGRMGADSGWRWAADSMGRTRNGTRAIDLLAGSVSVSRELGRQSSFGIGYVYGAGFPDAGSLGEHRLFQEFAWQPRVAGRVSLRTRLEERFVTGRMLVRVRQQVRVAWPLGARLPVRGVVATEVFVTASRTTPVARGLDAVRTFVGIERTVSARSGVQVGYVNLYWPRARAESRHGHALSARFVLSLQRRDRR
jgi:hypothetical protein